MGAVSTYALHSTPYEKMCSLYLQKDSTEASSARLHLHTQDLKHTHMWNAVETVHANFKNALFYERR